MNGGNVLNGNKGNSNYVWPVRGGQSGAFGSLTVSPAVTTFPATANGTQSTPVSVVLSNGGKADVAISAATITGAYADQFSLAPGGSIPCTSLTPTLTAGSSCTLSVLFAPTSGGVKNATLQVTSNDSTSSTISGILTGATPGIQLSLKAGWNLIGWASKQGYYDPAITAPLANEMVGSGSTSSRLLLDVFGDAGLTTGDNYLFMGTGGDVYIPGSRFNTLKKLLPGKGYWVKVDGAKTIIVPGSALGATDQMLLNTGWNQIGYWGADGASPSTGFACINGKYNVVTDEDGQVYIPDSRFNTLNSLQVNKGYFIHMTTPAILTYQCSLLPTLPPPP